jgi:hypothetical protein
MQGKLGSAKVCSTWRGALMSKRNHLRQFEKYPDMMKKYDPYVKIISMDAILAQRGIEYPGSEFSAEDLEFMKKIGLST